ncbi:dipeptide/oligopeptide/nickel ABC transporter permease/ATP-binding protein [Paraburkholderia guartelaensis]|uniref:dipeptide/oligopeptide/nickel ABC transporter permease/ATP-binding protein n=1 Tax=Paraburkholderia guartelaensis TaxID=2546446 RepID=UPI002AB61357|nr:dipeptide/oligopeptide/nickel ABC transporter permease/ATP-binding protein [Paraburkholderia guartelaensis]
MKVIKTTGPLPTMSRAMKSPDSPRVRRAGWMSGLRKPAAALASAWLALVVLLSVSSPLWRPYSPTDGNLTSRLMGPSAAHWFGTDELGRDILTRMFTASGPALLAAAITAGVALLIAVPLVLVAAERGGLLANSLSRSTEIVLALPGTVILLAVISAVGGDRTYTIMAIFGVLAAAPVYRVLLGVAQSLHKRLYVDAARVDGVSAIRISLRYIMPGMRTVVAVQASQLFAGAILVEAGLAFMGFGPSQPTPSWGGMIATASQYIYQQPWMMVPTGLLLTLTVIAANELALAIAQPGPAPLRRRGRPESPRNTTVTPSATATAVAIGTDRALLEIRSLDIELEDGTKLVTDVSLTVQAGEVLGLIGESGCGKTVTALSILGLLTPGVRQAAGSIWFDGRELTGMTERQLRQVRGRDIARIPQDPLVALDPLFTVGAQMMEPIMRLRGVRRAEARQIAIDLLKRVEIVDPERVLRSRPYELSGGMAQRVTIAMALTGNPRLLIGDEPTTALDVTVQMEILDLLHRLAHETGIAMIMVSHDMGVIADICDRVAVMYAGQIVECGPVEHVLHAPAQPYTMALLQANPHLPEDQPMPDRLAAISGRVPRPGDWPQGCRFAPRCQFAQPICQTPVDLASTGGGVLVRCVRKDEIRLTKRHLSEPTKRVVMGARS